MGGVDRHDRLRSTFSLGKKHKFKKYYISADASGSDVDEENGVMDLIVPLIHSYV
jgi:hypothetical protein